MLCRIAFIVFFFVGYAQANPDFDESGTVDFSDFLQFVGKYGTADPLFDLDGDGTVGFSDFLIFVSHFGERSPRVAYNIDLVISEDFTPHQKEIIIRAAKRWEQIIVGDLPDMDLKSNPLPFSDVGMVDDYIDDIRSCFKIIAS